MILTVICRFSVTDFQLHFFLKETECASSSSSGSGGGSGGGGGGGFCFNCVDVFYVFVTSSLQFAFITSSFNFSILVGSKEIGMCISA